MLTLFVFGHQAHARYAGFKHGIHKRNPSYRSITVEDYDPVRFRGKRFDCIILTESVYSVAQKRPTNYSEMRHDLVLSLNKPNGIWIEL